MFSHSKEDLHVKISDKIVQLILERVEMPTVKEVENLDNIVRGDEALDSTMLGHKPSSP